MKRIFTMIIDDESQVSLQTHACSNEGGNVFITARTLQEAQELIGQGEEKLNEAMQTWKPEEGQEAPATNPSTKRSFKEMDEAAKDYEDSPEGRRLLKRIEKAHEFLFKHRKGGLKSLELNYLANKCHNNFFNGSFDIAALEYMRGYMAGKKETKKEGR